ncbi:MAG: hypothetical protein KIH01_02965 [Candidatus Freyarchaeota archaeon]|nr:hypothetical protein [Candidatus Jordarchaeia archaeon]
MTKLKIERGGYGRLPVSILNTGVYEPIMYVLHAIVLGSCAVQLARRYMGTREKLTLLFVAYFAFMKLIALTDLLIVIDVATLNLLQTMALLALITMGLVATIGVVLLGLKQIYLLPAIVVIAMLYQYILTNTTYTTTLLLVRAYLYTYGIGSHWFMTLKTISPNILSEDQQIATIANMFLDPAEVMLTNTPLATLAMYESAIGIPTTILFYYLAWANKSGKSLGFALYLTTLLAWGFLVATVMETRSFISLSITLLAFIFLALGVFGILDKIIPKEKR